MRLIDYFVVPEGLKPHLQVSLATSPWRAHVGFDVTIFKNLPKHEGWKLELPKLLPARAAVPKVENVHSKTSRRRKKRLSSAN
eukprot:8574707-Karenia_brevis.AAC.1